ncbi:CotH kinase family protein [candidate division KSB1 bacterium]|nr:CotH kinase family protein [candidate division KSB1 bacterium]
MKYVAKSLCILLFLTAVHLNAQVNFTQSNLPIVVINTNDQNIPYDDPRIVADMGIIYNGVGAINHPVDPHNNYDGKINIEIRGSSSASWAKKQYALETQNDDGSNRNVSLLGMPAENDWILYAPYYDRSMMRNVLVYRLARQMGWWAPRTRFCELVLNGTYQGVYVLMEKIKIDKNRVDIATLLPEDTSGVELTGGYIIKIDKEQWLSGFNSPNRSTPRTVNRIRYQYFDPKNDELVDAQRNYIRDYVLGFESVMLTENYNDPVTGYPAYIDVASFIDYFIINEISKNVDGYRLSAYFYKDKDSRGGKLCTGPVWDYNFSFGNIGYYRAQQIDGWCVIQLFDQAAGDMWPVPFWWPKFVEDEIFMQQTCQRWKELRKDVLNLSKVISYIDAVADTLNRAVARNFQIWLKPGDPPPPDGSWWPPDYPISQFTTYQDETDYLKSWTAQRVSWLDREFARVTPIATEPASTRPASARIAGIYPNPFNATTTIRLTLSQPQHVLLTVWNVMGQQVGIILDKTLDSGNYPVNFDASELTSGIYMIRLVTSGGFSDVEKIVFVK